MLGLLKEAIASNGAPEYIRSDNGPEFIARAIQDWLSENQIKTIYIDPGGSGADRIVGAIRPGVRPGDAAYAAMT